MVAATMREITNPMLSMKRVTGVNRLRWSSWVCSCRSLRRAFFEDITSSET
jgi:hypothetical protein